MLERSNGSENTVLLLYAGRLSPEKNIELLPEILRSLTRTEIADYRLLIAGAGPKADWLAEECEKAAAGKAIQLGHLEKDELADLYANADVFIHPNPHEPFGIAPLEAMASGIPIVAPRGGGILSYADDDNAWLVEPTGEAFGSAIVEIITDPNLRDRKTAAAMKAVEANTREASTDRLFAAYDDLYERYIKQPEMFDGERGFDYAENALN